MEDPVVSDHSKRAAIAHQSQVDASRNHPMTTSSNKQN